MPAISVIMPVYNAATSLRQALDSVLAQTCTNFSLLVIDDGSTDNSREILNSYRDSRIVPIISPQNQGIEAALNLGLAAALSQPNCQYILRMDSDDICLPQRFALQLEFMQNNPSIWVLGSWAEMLHANSSSSLGCMPVGNDNIRARMLFHAPLIHPSCIIRRQVFDKIKYSRKYPGAEDYDLWCKLAANPQCGFDCLPKALLKYRLYGQSISLSRRSAQCKASNRVRASFLRRLGVITENNSEYLKIHNAWANQNYSLPPAEGLGQEPVPAFGPQLAKKLEAWAYYLLAYNKQINYCAPQALQLELAQRYYALAQSISAAQPNLAATMLTSPLIPANIEHASFF